MSIVAADIFFAQHILLRLVLLYCFGMGKHVLAEDASNMKPLKSLEKLTFVLRVMSLFIKTILNAQQNALILIWPIAKL